MDEGGRLGIRPCLLALGIVLAPGMATAEVVARFVAPDRFTDAANRFGSGLSLRVTVEEIRRIIVQEGERVLDPGESLIIDVLDIDLAGFEQPGANFPYGVRVVSDLTPPRFKIRYVLSRGKRRLAAGEETVTDQNFLMGARWSSGTFGYERELLRRWMRSRVAERPLRRP